MPTVKEVIESNYLALLTPLITLGLEVLAWSLMRMLAFVRHLEPPIDNSFAGRDGSDSTFKKTIQFESYNGEFDGSAQATPSPSYVGREGARTEECRQKVCFSAPKIMSEALEHPPLRSGLLQERISIDLHLHHELGRPRLGDLLVWIYREFPYDA